jgi:hypothetical protein
LPKAGDEKLIIANLQHEALQNDLIIKEDI